MKGFSCLIGFTLLFASIFMTFQERDDDTFIKFYNLLDDNQKNTYEKIINERFTIYFMGMIMGLGLGLFIGKTLLEKNFALIEFRNSKTRSGAEVIVKWENKDLFNI